MYASISNKSILVLMYYLQNHSLQSIGHYLCDELDGRI
jgi:hypothetical protein